MRQERKESMLIWKIEREGVGVQMNEVVWLCIVCFCGQEEEWEEEVLKGEG
jgi:hypothetical protein